MKEYRVRIAGADRLVRFNSFDAVTLHKRFSSRHQSLSALLWNGVLGYGSGEGRTGVGFDPEAQIAVLTAGLARGGTRCNEDLVTGWFDAHLAAGAPSGDLLWPAVKAFFYSGAVTGVRVDLDEVAQEVGKGPGTTVMGQESSSPAEAAPAAVAVAEGI